MEGQEGQSDRVEFLRFVMESGIHSILVDAVGELHELPEKPEDATDWLRKFFRRDAPHRCEELDNQFAILKEEVIQKEWRLAALRLEEKKKIKQLNMLRLQAKMNKEISSKNSQSLENDRYKDWPEKSAWRIQPDPFFRTTCSAGRLFGDKNKSETPGKIMENEEDFDSGSDDDVKKFITEKKNKLTKDNQPDEDDAERKDGSKKKRKDKVVANLKKTKKLNQSSASAGQDPQSPTKAYLTAGQEASEEPVATFNELMEEKAMGGAESEIAQTNPEEQRKQKKRRDKNKSKLDSRITSTVAKKTKKKNKQMSELSGIAEEELYPEPETAAENEEEEVMGSPDNLWKDSDNDAKLSIPKDHSELPRGYLEQYMVNIPNEYWTTTFSTITPSPDNNNNIDSEEESSTSSDDELEEIVMELSSNGFEPTSNKAPGGKWNQKHCNSQIIYENNWQLHYDEKGNGKDEEYYHVGLEDMVAAVTDPLKIEEPIIVKATSKIPVPTTPSKTKYLPHSALAKRLHPRVRFVPNPAMMNDNHHKNLMSRHLMD